MFPQFSIKYQVMSFKKKYRNDAVLFFMNLVQWYMVLICPITSDFNFHHSIKSCFLNFSTVKLYL